MQEMQGQSLGWEDLLKKEMALLSSIPAWEISRTEEPGGLQSVGSQRVRHNWATKNTQDMKKYTRLEVKNPLGDINSKMMQ